MRNLPFRVSCNEPTVLLFRLADSRYQLTKDGPLARFMSGSGYFLMEPKLVSFIEGLDIPRIEFEPAVVWDRTANQEFSNYSNLRVEQYFDMEMIEKLDLSGLQFYANWNCGFFVSPSLKLKLETGNFEYLEFHEGLSGIAGNIELD